jgi:hypothetical protein
MKRSVFFSLLCLCFFEAGSFPPLAPAGTGPRMVIEQARVDFGEVEQWDILTHTFTVTNTGDDILRIERVSPD